jgi:hypothetical protein
MNPLLLGSVFELGKSVIDRLFPDPQKKAEAELELLQLTQSGGLQKVMAQLEINAKEAQHQSIWVAGWRPFIGWISGLGFAYAAVVNYVLAWVSSIQGWPAPPTIDNELLLIVLGGILGLGSLRTYEKKNGITK